MYKQSYIFPNKSLNLVKVVTLSVEQISIMYCKYVEFTGKVRMLLHVLAFIFGGIAQKVHGRTQELELDMSL